jgi:predicted Zn-dependent peptidase
LRTGGPLPVSTYDERIESLTVDDLRRFAERYIVHQPKVLGVLGAPELMSVIGGWMQRFASPGL